MVMSSQRFDVQDSATSLMLVARGESFLRIGFHRDFGISRLPGGLSILFLLLIRVDFRLLLLRLFARILRGFITHSDLSGAF